MAALCSHSTIPSHKHSLSTHFCSTNSLPPPLKFFGRLSAFPLPSPSRFPLPFPSISCHASATSPPSLQSKGASLSFIPLPSLPFSFYNFHFHLVLSVSCLIHLQARVYGLRAIIQSILLHHRSYVVYEFGLSIHYTIKLLCSQFISDDCQDRLSYLLENRLL